MIWKSMLLLLVSEIPVFKQIYHNYSYVFATLPIHNSTISHHVQFSSAHLRFQNKNSYRSVYTYIVLIGLPSNNRINDFQSLGLF